MSKIVVSSLAVAALLSVACCPQNKGSFPAVNQNGKTAIVAHRGFWKCEAGGYSENSIASLKAAQDAGLWGSECDVHLTADNVVIVNHDDWINGKKITETNYAEFALDTLPNGEMRPTIDAYLTQAESCTATRIIIEFKALSCDEAEVRMVDKTLDALKAHGLFDPSRVGFISFRLPICERLAEICPDFLNQYLGCYDEDAYLPHLYASQGINGIDYYYPSLEKRPDFVSEAHSLNMSVNAWTVNKPEAIQNMIDLGVDAITSNEPLLVREMLGDKEFRN